MEDDNDNWIDENSPKYTSKSSSIHVPVSSVSPNWTLLYRLRRLTISSPKMIAYKNVFGAGVPYMLIFSCQGALVTLQSSLNADQGLGLATLAIFASSVLIAGLFTSSIIQLFGTKYSLIICYGVTTVYIIANFYPRWYTLVPSAICNGFAQAPILASVNVHLTTIAIKFAPDLNEKTDHLIAFFTGLVTMFFKMAYIPGNLATTVILFSERHNSDSDIIDTSLGNVCNNTEENELNPTYVYILMSTFVLITIIAIVITLLFMDHLGTDFKFHSCSRALTLYVRDPIVSTLKMFTDWKIYMLLSMMLTDGFITSTTLGRLSKYYVSDCIGVHWVGLFSMAYGVSSAICALIAGRLAKWIPQFMMVYLMSIMLLATLVFLIFWEREPSYLVVFLPIVIIGLGEGMWNSVPPTLIGILFPKNKEPAYSALRMGFSSGFIVGFITALFLEVQVSLWMEVGFIVISLITYSILVFVTHTKQQLLPSCCYISEENNSNTNDDELEDMLDFTETNDTVL